MSTSLADSTPRFRSTESAATARLRRTYRVLTGNAAGTSEKRNAVHLIITDRRHLANDVVEFTLRRPDGARLPDWSPGAHIDVILPDGTTRQYSLCGDRWDAHTYGIAVQREDAGRGGSVALHNMPVGSTVGFGGPRNNFRLAPAARYLFIAGGIGVTPILPMVRQADLLGIDWRLLYLGRSRSALAYRDELAPFEGRVSLHCADEAGRAMLEEWRPADAETRVYACGPTRLLDAVEEWDAAPGGFAPKTERFAASTPPPSTTIKFDVVASRSGASTTVRAEETVTAALRRIGVEVLTSCAQGVCGTCETDVLSGRPEHRDSLLDDAERSAASCMFPCVSRSLDARLVLDL
ncbi:PDR/VanB family oxidoreductase [Microbacterium lacus]|uniref:PDR/VanB family oxidoreductase n=1 Tax=Microbacterium lacus TaxID=415217 RepID=UPI00384CE992